MSLYALLEAQSEASPRIFAAFAELADHAYAPGKWTVKEVLGHLIDDERVWGYRMLCVARREPLALPGFDENLYAREGGFRDRTLSDLVEEFQAVRRATVLLLRSLQRGLAPCRHRERLPRHGPGPRPHDRGPRAHHHRILEERYLRAWRSAPPLPAVHPPGNPRGSRRSGPRARRR